MDAREFLVLAGQLTAHKDARPVHFRAAIGRAYYAAFNAAVQALTEIGFPPAGSSNTHKQIVLMLQKCGDEELGVTGGILGDLHSNRLKADYELRRTNVEKLTAAQAAVETAAEIFADVDTFMKNDDRRSGVAAVLASQYRSITGKPAP
jgi:uncharacterized protein (UPF0332 family)